MSRSTRSTTARDRAIAQQLDQMPITRGDPQVIRRLFLQVIGMHQLKQDNYNVYKDFITWLAGSYTWSLHWVNKVDEMTLQEIHDKYVRIKEEMGLNTRPHTVPSPPPFWRDPCAMAILSVCVIRCLCCCFSLF